VGPVGSGTRASAEQILGKGGVNSETATLLPFAGSAAVEAMNDGKVDAVWILGAPNRVTSRCEKTVSLFAVEVKSVTDLPIGP
jgi:TRAP-type uncharacterized transport system substrate-binding protein